MDVLGIYLFQIALFSGIPFYLATLRPPIRAAAFYIYISIILFLGGFAGSLVSFPLTESTSVSGGNIAYGALFMATILLVIIENQIAVVKQVIRLVITVDILKILFFTSLSLALKSDLVIKPFLADPTIFSISSNVTIQGGILIIVELLLLVFVFEKIKARVKNTFALSSLYALSFSFVLCLDGFLFPLLAFTTDPNIVPIIIGGVTTKVFLALSFAPPIYLFMMLFRNKVKYFNEKPMALRHLISASKEQLTEEIGRQRKSLDKSEARYRLLAESIGDVFFSLDSDLRYTYWNQASESLGYSDTEVLGKSIGEVFPYKLESAEVNYYKTAMLNEENNLFETDYIVNGEKHIFEVSAFHLKEGLSVIARDITERIIQEERQQNAQKLESLGTLAGGVAHDFNNILAVIQGYTELSILSLSKNDVVSSYLDNISIARERATDLVRQILTFSRMGSGEINVMDPVLAVEEAVKMLRAAIPSSIKISVDLQANCGKINADRTQVNQVLINVATNAYHSMEEKGGTLKISMTRLAWSQSPLSAPPGLAAQQCLKISIKDTGSGMNQVTLKKIFDPFFTTKDVGKGTGLGLAVAHGIMIKLQGDITVDSVLGEGTTFSLYFPLAEDNAISVETTVPESANKKGCGQILLVDDEPSIRELYHTFLDSLGYEVTLCCDGQEALDLFNNYPWKFDLVFTDFNMPNMDGNRLAEALLKIRPNLPIILATGLGTVLTKEYCTAQGIRRCLSKPISLSTLSSAVEDCLKTV